MINRRRVLSTALAAFGAAERRIGTADFPIGYLGLRWEGLRDGGSVRFRTGDSWSRWRPVPHGDSPGGGRHGVLVPADGAVGYEVSLPAGSHALQTVAINTTDGPRARPAVPPYGAGMGLRFRGRAGWGAD